MTDHNESYYDRLAEFTREMTQQTLQNSEESLTRHETELSVLRPSFLKAERNPLLGPPASLRSGTENEYLNHPVDYAMEGSLLRGANATGAQVCPVKTEAFFEQQLSSLEQENKLNYERRRDLEYQLQQRELQIQELQHILDVQRLHGQQLDSENSAYQLEASQCREKARILESQLAETRIELLNVQSRRLSAAAVPPVSCEDVAEFVEPRSFTQISPATGKERPKPQINPKNTPEIVKVYIRKSAAAKEEYSRPSESSVLDNSVGSLTEGA